jgi:hypothetical protein
MKMADTANRLFSQPHQHPEEGSGLLRRGIHAELAEGTVQFWQLDCAITCMRRIRAHVKD